MPLSPEEQAELAALESKFSGAPLGLSPEEQAELGQLETRLGDETPIQEQHPDVSFKDRFVAKNFANSEDAQAKYIQAQHPELQVKTIQGQVAVRRKGEPWRVIDPSSADWQDISDVTADVGAGIGTGAATAAGGLAGNLPGAIGAGAASAGGLEGLRQKIGRWMGVPQDMDYGQVGTSAAFGAAAPVLFGSGATAAQVAKNALARGVPEAAVAQGQKGAVTRLAPRLAEYMSGVPAEATRTYAGNRAAIKNMTDAGAVDLAEQAHNKLRGGVADAQKRIYSGIESAAAQTGRQVDIGPAKAEIDNMIASLENSELANTPAVREQIANLKESRANILTEAADGGIPQDIPNMVSAKKALELQGMMSDAGQMYKVKNGLKSGRFTPGTSPDEIAWMQANQKAKNLVNQGIDQATEGASGSARKEYAKLAGLKDNVAKYFSSKEKTYNTMKNIDTPSKTFLRDQLSDIKGMTGVDITPEAKLLEASKFYTNPSWTPVSSSGTTSTSRTAGLGGLGALIGYKLGGGAGALMGATAGNLLGSPMAIRTYTDAIMVARQTGRPLAEVLEKAGLTQPAMASSAWNMMNNNK